ncbi:MAG: four helix bundle protein, partial [Candidatus Binatia bacterium]
QSRQMQRASISIPSNLAEGHSRDSTPEFLRNISIAMGSLAELETQLLMAERLGYVPKTELTQLLTKTDELGKMLRGLQKSLKLRRERGGRN